MSREKAYEAVKAALGSDAYDCVPVRADWTHGEAEQYDFRPLANDPCRVREIADAAIDAVLSGVERERDVAIQERDLAQLHRSAAEAELAACRAVLRRWSTWGHSCAACRNPADGPHQPHCSVAKVLGVQS